MRSIPTSPTSPLLQLILTTVALLITTPGLAIFGLHHDSNIVTKTVQRSPAFDTIHMDGPLTLKLQQNPKYNHHIQVTGPQALLTQLTLNIANRRLEVHLPFYDEGDGKVIITVQTPMLADLSQGGDSATSAYFRDQLAPLNIHLHGHSQLTLDGMVQLHTLQQKNNSQSKIVFANSHQLSIQLNDHSHAYIAGRAKQLLAKANDHSTLSSQHLRTDSAWLQAQNNATIRVSPLHESHAFAKDQAHIMYDSTPHHSSAYHTDTATVVRLP